MVKGTPNPWAMYRQYVRVVPDKGYISPWEIKQITSGKTPFDKGQIFIQKAQKGEGEQRVSRLRHWIDQLNESIKMSRGDNQRRFIEQRDRLRGML